MTGCNCNSERSPASIWVEDPHRGPPPQPEADGALTRRPPMRAAAASIAGHAAAASAGYKLDCTGTRSCWPRFPMSPEVDAFLWLQW